MERYVLLYLHISFQIAQISRNHSFSVAFFHLLLSRAQHSNNLGPPLLTRLWNSKHSTGRNPTNTRNDPVFGQRTPPRRSARRPLHD